jgi:hypothetical protein
MNLQKLARTIRSKNAGAYYITVEIIFNDPEIFRIIKENDLINVNTIAKAYGLKTEDIKEFVLYEPGLGIKANFKRKTPSGGPGETDVYGCQQYAPLLEVELGDEWFC